MKCQEIFERLGDYIDRELDDEICKEIEGHVENCEPCIAFINTLKKTVELFQGVGVAEAKEAAPDAVSSNLERFLQENIEKGGSVGK